MNEEELSEFFERNDFKILDINSNEIPKALPVIYFLFNGDELVYIGETKNLDRRLCQHHEKWNCTVSCGGKKTDSDLFNKVWFIETVEDRKKRWDIEQDLIKTFFVKCNDFGWVDVALQNILECGEEESKKHAMLYFGGD